MVAALLLPAVILTQAFDSTYDRRALRLAHGPGSTVIVEGIQATGVGGGSFVPGTGVLAFAKDSVSREYKASRAAFQRYTVLGLVSLAGVLATMEYYGKPRRDWQPGWGIGLPVALAFGWAGQANAASGDNHLRRSIWRYNRDFPRTFVFDSTACGYDVCALRVRSGAWSTRLVRGVNEIPIGRPESQRDLFAAAGDSALVHYEAFLRLSMETRKARRVATVAYLGAGVLYAASDRKVARDAAFGLMILGYAAGHGSVYGQASADSELDTAIWFYNRTLR